jgi:hypothetical protein
MEPVPHDSDPMNPVILISLGHTDVQRGKHIVES